MPVAVYTYAERPELWRATAAITEEVWPTYNQHGDVIGRYWGRLFEEFPSFQFVLYDEQAGEVQAEGHSIPCEWDGTVDGLGDGIDDMITAAFGAHGARRKQTALCALAAEVRPPFRELGFSGQILDAMSAMARSAGLAHLIAPVRPSLKDHYPITPIERYITWTREDGQPFDPWIGVHLRRGGEIVKAAPQSMLITGTIAQWQGWTCMRFPDDGRYTFPEGLSPLEIDQGRDLGTYWEPNVWIVHALQKSARA
jgi:GNAT superfamily N-acetyltransferase